MISFESIAQNIYNDISTKNQLLFQKKRNEIYERYPDIKNIEEQLIQKKIDKVGLGLSKNKNELEIKQCEKEIDALIKELSLCLEKHSLSQDDLNMKYDCSICKDTGFVSGQKCSCYKKKEIEYLREQLFLTSDKKEDFSKLDFSYYDQKFTVGNNVKYLDFMKNQICCIHELLIKYQKENIPVNIIIRGSTGTGKTFLAKCIANKFLDMEKTVAFLTADELIKSTFKNSDLLDYAQEAELLVLDNLGKENVSDYSNKVIFNLIDYRLTKMKSTVITTLNDFKEINDYLGDDLCSRLFNCYEKIPLMGEDLRRRRNV